MKMMQPFHFPSLAPQVFKRSSFWPAWLVNAFLFVVLALLLSCASKTKVPDDDSLPVPVPDDGYIEIRLTPHGGTFALGENGVLRVPVDAVTESTDIRVRTLTPGALNRLLYKRNVVNRHYAGRTIGSTTYYGSGPWLLAAGVEIRPSGIHFNAPIQVELSALPGVQPTAPLQVKVDESRDELLVQPGRVIAMPISDPTSPHPELPPSTHTLVFQVTEASSHAVVDTPPGPEWIDCATIDPSDPVVWADACKVCGKITVESGEIDYGVGQCMVKQLTTRTTFHDCPGSPVEENTQQILTPECGVVEPIEDLLNYRPGKTWNFRFHRVRVVPALTSEWAGSEWSCGGDVTVNLSLSGEVTILRDCRKRV